MRSPEELPSLLVFVIKNVKEVEKVTHRRRFEVIDATSATLLGTLL